MSPRSLGLLSLGLLASACASDDDGAPEPGPGPTDTRGPGMQVDPGETAAPTPPTLYGDGCVTAADGAWASRAIPQTSTGYVVTFDASAGELGGGFADSVIGLADGTAIRAEDLGPALRFSPAGVLEARNGTAFTAETEVRYQPGNVHRVMMTVDLATSRYDVSVSDYTGSGLWIPIGTQYAFAGGLPRVGHLAVGAVAGSVKACEPTVFPARCVRSTTGASWAAQSFPARTTPFQVELEITAEARATEMIIGVGGAGAAGPDDLAAMLRLDAEGHFEAADGDRFVADVDLEYRSDWPFRAVFAVDPAAGSYAVWVVKGDGAPTLIGHHLVLRNAVTDFATLGQFSGDDGDLGVCDLTVGL